MNQSSTTFVNERESYDDMVADEAMMAELKMEEGEMDQLAIHKQGKWSKDEDDLLKRTVDRFGERQWRKISDQIPGRTAIQCLHRWTKILKPGLVKGPWTLEEDERLKEWVRNEGPTKWAQSAAYISGRSGKQCRERWYNNLCPSVKKGNWSEEEDEAIFRLYRQFGSSWSKIAKYLAGRTENSIKNRFYSTLRKIAADRKKSTNPKEDEEIIPIIAPVVEEKPKVEELKPEEIVENGVSAAANNASNFLYKLLCEGNIELRKRSYMDREEEEAPARETQKSKEKRAPRSQKRRPKAVQQTTQSKPEVHRMPAKQKPAEFNEDEESHFDNFLSNVENTLNSELRQKELHVLKKRLFGTNPMLNISGLEEDFSPFKTPFSVITPQKPTQYLGLPMMGQDLLGAHWQDTTPCFIPDQRMMTQHVVHEETNNNINLDQKMVFLLEKLQTLEGMLSNTRQELLKLELSFDGDGKQPIALNHENTSGFGNGFGEHLIKTEFDRLSDEISVLDKKRQGRNDQDSESISRLPQMYEDFFNYT